MPCFPHSELMAKLQSHRVRRNPTSFVSISGEDRLPSLRLTLSVAGSSLLQTLPFNSTLPVELKPSSLGLSPSGPGLLPRGAPQAADCVIFAWEDRSLT